MTQLRFLFGAVIGFAALAALWEVYISITHPPTTIAPSITTVVNLFLREPMSYLSASFQTLGAILFTWLLGSIAATITGFALGRSKRLDWLTVNPILFFSTIPIITWAPLFVLWMGVTSGPIIACGLLAAYFPSLQAARGAARNPPAEYMEAARNLGADERALVRTVVLPSMLPTLVSGWRSSIQLTFLVVPVAEMVLRKGGLGAVVGRGLDLARADMILLGQLSLGMLGLFVYSAIAMVETRSLRWLHVKDT